VDKSESVIREELVRYGCKLLGSRLTVGSGGNLSIIDRENGRIFITPSGMDYLEMSAADIVWCGLDGRLNPGQRKPSSELDFHLALYKQRADIGAVVHTHSVYATTIACLGREIPAVHYLVGFAGAKVPIAPYATFGTPALTRAILENIGAYNALLLANHGLIAVGSSLTSAFTVAEEIEFVARIYYQSMLAGEPKLLSEGQMEEVLVKFKSYGQSDPAAKIG
jgi:L-fuculose-phosphate aldolase